MQLSNEYSDTLTRCLRSGKVILNVFVTGINTHYVIFACFLNCVLGVFNSLVAVVCRVWQALHLPWTPF